MGAHYERIPECLERMIRRFGVGNHRDEIRTCFDLVCGESRLAGSDRSSLNQDGTPVQFALSMARGRPAPFEFVGEAFRAGMDHEARRALGLERMLRVAETLGIGRELIAARPRLDAASARGLPGDGEDPVGAFWLGASFEPDGDASMTVYANARRGEEAARWKRLATFAEEFGKPRWSRIAATVQTTGLRPLGVGLRLCAGRGSHARVYFGAYGVRPACYQRMFREVVEDGDFARGLGCFFEELLGAEHVHPTRSAVVSFGVDADGELSPKLELCAHCAWSTKEEAAARCDGWLARLGMDAGHHRDVLDVLARAEEPAVPTAHAYVGLGMKRGEAYASVYVNPGRAL